MSKILVVDNDLRKIIIPDEVKHLGVESDDGVKRLKFRLPRYCEEFDLSQFVIRINYTNAAKGPDSYLVKDAKAAGADVIEFSWLVGRYALAFKGDVKFSLCLKKITGTGLNAIVLKEFNTQPAVLPVLEGLETTERVIDVYPDLVQMWQEEFYGRFNGRIDDTLTIAGMGADALAVGDYIRKLEERVETLERMIGTPVEAEEEN